MSDDCIALERSRTFRCRLLGCKRAEPRYWDDVYTDWDECGKTVVHVLCPDDLGYFVHEGCCFRCGQPVIPTARVARR